MPPRLYWATQFLTARSEHPRLWARWDAVQPCLARRTAWTRFQERFWGMASAITWSWARLWWSATSTAEAPGAGDDSPHPAKSKRLAPEGASLFRKPY